MSALPFARLLRRSAVGVPVWLPIQIMSSASGHPGAILSTLLHWGTI
jgi:hypothetical protein